MEKKLKAVDFFCSGGGMTWGFNKAGISVLGGIDIDPKCQQTYTYNNPSSKFILSDIKTLSHERLTQELKISVDDDDLIFIGCSPCQYWTKLHTDKTKSKESKDLLNDFVRFVKHFNPGYVVIENVPGILRRLEESPLPTFLKFLKKNNYKFVFDVINACHYGVPQTRKRFVLIASRLNVTVKLPEPDTQTCIPTVRNFIGDYLKFPVIKAGNIDDTDYLHTAGGLSEKNLQRISLTPFNGGSRTAWSETHLQIAAYLLRDKSFQDIYGRMSWDKPAPTITTKFYSLSNGRFGHPEQHRALSIREGATLQTFDVEYKFITNSLAGAGKLIGNAVPPELSKRIAKSIKQQ